MGARAEVGTCTWTRLALQLDEVRWLCQRRAPQQALRLGSPHAWLPLPSSLWS